MEYKNIRNNENNTRNENYNNEIFVLHAFSRFGLLKKA